MEKGNEINITRETTHIRSNNGININIARPDCNLSRKREQSLHKNHRNCGFGHI